MLRRLLAASLLSLPAVAADVLVPGDAATIQGGIALAEDGDRVLVAAGSYAETLDFLGKTIEVIGVDGAHETILDAAGLAAPGVLVAGATSGPGTRLAGITVRGSDDEGVHVTDDATLAVELCVVEQCAGRGVLADDGGAVTLDRCIVRDNPGGGTSTGGFGFGSNLQLDRCLVEGNGGPGVFVGNGAPFGGGAAESVTNFFAVYQNATFLGNTATTSGGGLYIFSSDDGFLGGSTSVSGCVFAGNQAPVGSALYMEALPSAPPGENTISACTFVGDDVYACGELDVTDSIARGVPTPFTASDAITITYSNVEGGAAGVGNIDADPLFVSAANDVFCLLPSSPCIDSGDPSSPLDPDGSPADMGAIPFTSFCDAGAPLFGTLGPPDLSGSGDLTAGSPLSLVLDDGPPSGTVTLFIGAAPLFAGLKGGVLVPAPLFLIGGLPTGPDGDLPLAGTWPAGVPSGTVVWLQSWAADAAGEKGFSATNGLALVAP